MKSALIEVKDGILSESQAVAKRLRERLRGTDTFMLNLMSSPGSGKTSRTWYLNAAVDTLIEEGQHAADESLRDAAYRRAEETVIADMPWVPFWHKQSISSRSPA